MKILIALIIFILFPAKASAQNTPYIEGYDFFNDTALKLSTGEFSFSVQDIFQKLADLFTTEIKNNAHYLILFFIIGTISSIINLMEFNDKNQNTASFFACYTLCAGLALKILSNILEYSISVTDIMADFITKLAPILTTLIITSGKTISAGVFHPILASSVFVITLIVKKCIIPLSVYGSVLSVANNLNEQIQISSFCRLISSVSKWILTAAFTIFAGICGIYGFSAPALDAIGSKAAKFAIGSLVPVVGRFLSDSLETVISGSQLIKNVAGSAGIITLFSICAIPVIKISVMLIFMRICIVFTEPLADKKITKLLTDIADIATVIFGMLLTITVLFIICISIIIASTN